MLKAGLYEQVLNEALTQALAELPKERKDFAAIDPAEAPKVLAQYVAGLVQRGLENLSDKDKSLADQIGLINRIIEQIGTSVGEAWLTKYEVAAQAQQLFAVLGEQSPLLALGRNAKDLPRPVTSLAQSSLFTGTPKEPQLASELKKEILSADRIDWLVSFVKWSGLRLLRDELTDFANRGGQLRVITTSYIGATDLKAVEWLSKLPHAQVKISYDTKLTRLHAKAYCFIRETGFSTAYIGSSNLSNPALSEGLEWNIKVTRQDQPETMAKVEATFETYWNDNRFVTFDGAKKEDRDRLETALQIARGQTQKEDGANPYIMDIHPFAYQQEILDNLAAERTIHGRWKNLVVAATGTGKTVIAALDFRRFRRARVGKTCRLLFVAHREELLQQGLYTFRSVLKDPNFGDVMAGGKTPDQCDHLFITVQTLNSRNLTGLLPADYYDYIVVDEFHHAAADTYQTLLGYFKPQILLGLTATPERMDGQSILKYFDDHTAAEIRLPEAIERGLLCPFQYFGVTDDSVDLRKVKWSRGRYDQRELARVYTLDDQVAKGRATAIAHKLEEYSTDLADVKALGFCVSVEHAKFMAEQFKAMGIPAVALSSESSEEERHEVPRLLKEGKIKCIFVVDLYNEGVDIPEVNTVLFLRPTESLTVFLQQLGRGLRLCEGKECLTVLDFIGQANTHYNFESKFRALLRNTTQGIGAAIKTGFPNVPKGCSIQLERVAAKYVLENVRAAYENVKGLLTRIQDFEEESGQPLTLANFLNFYQLDPRTFYRHRHLPSLASARAKLQNLPSEVDPEFEDTMHKAFVRFSVTDSKDWIRFLLNILPRLRELDVMQLSLREQRMMQMFHITIWETGVQDWHDPVVREHLRQLAECETLRNELADLLRYRLDKIDFISEPLDIGVPDCPLELHCRYTRDQLFVALDHLNPGNIREGVKWLPEKQLDVFLVTLKKAEKDYSPSTLYQDYAINETLFHWQSQSTTSETSITGQRYIHHQEQGTRILFFARETKTDTINSQSAAAYICLGTAHYVKHEGSRPMSITWELDAPIPARFLKEARKLLAG